MKLIEQPQEFFFEMVQETLGKKGVRPQPETEYYLVNLLNQFILTDNLYARGEDGAYREEPLALLIKEALEQPERRQQSTIFRHVGDFSLYVGGFFQESLTRKSVDLGYYITVGEAAYKNVASRVDEPARKIVFEELADKFKTFVDVFSEIGTQTTPRREQDLLRLIEMWQSTGSERAARALHEAGIDTSQMTNANGKKGVQ